MTHLVAAPFSMCHILENRGGKLSIKYDTCLSGKISVPHSQAAHGASKAAHSPPLSFPSPGAPLATIPSTPTSLPKSPPYEHNQILPSRLIQIASLDKPDKPDVLAWQSDRRAALPRRVFVIARADGQTHELYIDISNNNSITSDKIYDGFGYPRVNVEEIMEAFALPFNYTPFVESVRKRGLELKDVACLVSIVGWYGEEMQGMRLVNLLAFVTGDTVNLYMRPMEGVRILVDLDAMEIVEYKDIGRWFRCRRWPVWTTEHLCKSRRSGRGRSQEWWSSRRARGS